MLGQLSPQRMKFSNNYDCYRTRVDKQRSCQLAKEGLRRDARQVLGAERASNPGKESSERSARLSMKPSKSLTLACSRRPVLSKRRMVSENNCGYKGLRDFDLWMAAAGIELAPVERDQAHIAWQAFRRYWKRRHPAALNSGDCFSYALAKATGFPLYSRERVSQRPIFKQQ
jgi:uncharacterized protein with PIN domain